MITLLEYLVVAAVIGAIVFFLAVVVFGRGEQIAPLDPRTAPAELPESAISAGDVRAVRFSMALRGYRMSDVDWTLDRLGDELDELRRENAELKVLAGAAEDGPITAPLARSTGPATPDLASAVDPSRSGWKVPVPDASASNGPDSAADGPGRSGPLARGSDVQGSDLPKSVAFGSDRSGSGVSGPQIPGSADLGSADLGSADLGSADLGSADLGSADLGSADLGSADQGSGRPRSGDQEGDAGHPGPEPVRPHAEPLTPETRPRGFGQDPIERETTGPNGPGPEHADRPGADPQDPGS